MREWRNSLQYLNGLRVFEAAARHGSFSKAAEELNVTQAAVSRSVRILEERLGLRLFERFANRLVPTAQGKMLGPSLSANFAEIMKSIERVAAIDQSKELTVGVGSTFAIRWLIPRLATFHEANPDMNVRVAVASNRSVFQDDWTCGIRFYEEKKWDGYVAETLFDSFLVPVCCPAIARHLKHPANLAGETILRVNSAPEDWNIWLRAAKLPPLAPSISFASYAMALQAAVDGVGVAMALHPYVAEDLAAGRLVAPFPQRVQARTPWALVYRHTQQDEPELIRFREWLFREAQNADFGSRLESV